MSKLFWIALRMGISERQDGELDVSDHKRKESQLIGRTGISPLRVVIYDRDPAERWLIGTYLRQRTDRFVDTEEIDDISDIEMALNQGGVDVLLADIDFSDDLDCWLKQIVESQLAPVVVLTGRMTARELPSVCKEGAAEYLFKHHMTREDLIQTMDGAMAKWNAAKRNSAHEAELERFANYDTLTGLLNRRSALVRLGEAMERARRYGEHVSISLIDIDRFSDFNEMLGRDRGDAVLVRISSLLQTRTRQADILGRYTGDSFLSIFPHTDLASVWKATERIRQLVEAINFDIKDGIAHTVTVSGGVATYEAGDDAGTMTYKAESSLSRAKSYGRNRVEK